MEYRRLGATDLKVSVLTLGVWQLGDSEYWGPVEAKEAEATVRAAIDSGVNLFDTAEWYGAGRSEEVLGQALGGRRKDVLLASKVSPQNCSSEGVRKACEASLARLRTDVIDVYQVHWPNPEIPFEETYSALERLQKEGKIRAIGVSNFGPEDLTAWLSVGACASNQIGYNLLFRAAEWALLPACVEQGVGVLVYMPLMQGILSGRWKGIDEIPAKRRRTRHFASTREGTMHHEAGAEELLMATLRELEALAQSTGTGLADLAIAWVASRSGVTSVIAGAGKPDQVVKNAAAASLRLADDVARQMDAITAPLKQALGSNLDMWKSGKEARIR